VRPNEIAALIDEAPGVESEQLHPIELTTTDAAASVERHALWAFVFGDIFEVVDYFQQHREHREHLCFALERFPKNTLEPNILGK
jgi:hypothetical protein